MPRKLSASPLGERASGVLLHPTSLPGPHGAGDLGPSADRFAAFLASAGQRFWQLLPVGPVGYGNSPYSALSTFAGSELLVSPERLAARGYLPALPRSPPFSAGRVSYPEAQEWRGELRRRAFAGFEQGATPAQRRSVAAFVRRSRGWLEDWVLYRALKRANGEGPWTAWPTELRDRHPAALAQARRALARELSLHRFEQACFDEQWRELRASCAARGVLLLGDLPIFVAHDSADVWAHRELFRLDRTGQPEVVTGVPPDYFSATGQRWGNPHYRWQALRRTGYRFWVERLRSALSRFDAVRIDHFIGITRAFEIPANAPTAKDGRWRKGPGASLLLALQQALGALPLVAEDLGAITGEVKALRDRFQLPGMRILQFAFGDDPSAPDFKPHAYPRRCVVYTGTHDNDTTAGWFHDPGGKRGTRSPAQAERERRLACDYLGVDGSEIHWSMIRAALASVADLAIVPVQDLLGLGSEARMNHPGASAGSWEWRLAEGALTPAHAARLAHLTALYGRSKDAE